MIKMKAPSHIELKSAKAVLSFVIVIAIGCFYINEFRKNPLDINALSQNINVCHLIVALLLSLLSYLVETIIWKSIIDGQIDSKKITFREIAVILYASGLFRYLPGRIWIYSAQILWFKKYGINKPLILFINLVCMVELIILSLYFGLMYMSTYTSKLSMSVVIMLFVSLILANLLFNCYGNILINKILVLAGKLTKAEVRPINISHSLMVIIQFTVTISWIFAGLALYFMAKGVGLHIVIADTVPVIASMSLSWLAGYLAVVSPGGLGVREGMMLLMLKPVLAVQTALLLPILSRVILLLSEAFLGLLALALGLRHDVFSVRNNDGVL